MMSKCWRFFLTRNHRDRVEDDQMFTLKTKMMGNWWMNVSQVHVVAGSENRW